MIFFFNSYFKLKTFFNVFSNNMFPIFLFNVKSLPSYFLLNSRLWQEGLYVDFLQKKFIDNWVTRFLIHSSALFNERLVFEKVVRFYLDLVINPLHKFFIFDFSNISSMMFINVFVFLIFIFLIFIVYFFCLMF